MRIGKLDNDDLNRLILHKFTHLRPEALTVPAIGEDCAVLDMGDDYIVLSADPITSAGIRQLGSLTVHVNCNDAVSSGAVPVGLLVTLLVPPSITEAEIDQIADDLASAARAAGVDILGGHTEVTDCVTRPVTSACVVARRARKAMFTDAAPGQTVIMTKYAALEGSAILAEDALQNGLPLEEVVIKTCLSLKDSLSVVAEGTVALSHDVAAMHDVTEGGVLGAAWELAYRTGLGIRVDTRAIPVLYATKEICAAYRVDPLRLIGSGSLLIACSDPQPLIFALKQAGIPAAAIGQLTASGYVDEAGRDLPPPGSDELYCALALARGGHL